MTLTTTIFLLLSTLTLSAYIEYSDHILGQDLGEGLSVYRKLVLKENANFVKNHNDDPTLTWKVKLYPQFAALTPQEVTQKYMNSNMASMISQHKDSTIQPVKLTKTTEEKSELKLKGVKQLVNLTKLYGTYVKDQGACGNCYAYATVDAVNMFYRRMGMHNGAQLSVQQLTDCSKNYLATAQNNGCQGGWYFASYIFLLNVGLNTEANYPYSYNTVKSGKEQLCKGFNGKLYNITRPSYFNDNELLSPYAASCNSRKPYLRSGFAISVAMYSSDQAFYSYSSGVIKGCFNPKGAIYVNHAVLLVGFQSSTVFEENFLIVKNSWGIKWGQLGHFRVLDPPTNSAAYNKCYLCNYGYLSLP